MSLRRVFPALLAGCLVVPVAHAARFTYHGELMDGDAPAQGRYDLEVRAFTSPAGGRALGEASVLPAVAMQDGSFAVEIELPEDPDGTTWVQVALRASGSNAAFEPLGERQAISKANSTCPGAWALDGNTGLPSGSFLGIADAAATTTLELRAQNSSVARFTPNSSLAVGDAPAVALGSSINAATAVGATVGGGGSSALFEDANQAIAQFATVGGGRGNSASGDFSTVGGGRSNSATGASATVTGGISNLASGTASNVSGGNNTRATGFGATAAGSSNLAQGNQSTVPGGILNFAGGNFSFAAGSNARVRAGGGAPPNPLPFGLEAADYTGQGAGDQGSFVWSDGDGSVGRSSGPNQFVIKARGGLRWIGSGVGSTTSPAVIHAVEAFPGPTNNRCNPATDRTAIDHPLLNGNPNAIIVVTPNYGPVSTGVAPPRNPYGVYYQDVATAAGCPVGRWVLYDLTVSPQPLVTGQRFNLWFVLP